MNDIQPWESDAPLKAEIDPGGTDVPPPPESPLEEWVPQNIPLQIQEQRVSQRYAARGGRSWLGWYEWNVLRQTAAWILNISASGCLVAADAPAPTNVPIWLRLDDPAVPQWIEVRVIDHQAVNSGMCISRLVFKGTCPYDLMKAVAFNAARQPSKPDPSRSWGFNSW